MGPERRAGPRSRFLDGAGDRSYRHPPPVSPRPAPVAVNDFFDRRFFVDNAHQAKGIGAMARSVMIWPQVDAPLFVELGMIGPERIEAGRTRLFVHGDAREQAPDSLDPGAGRPS